jgi:hypothetical protein
LDEKGHSSFQALQGFDMGQDVATAVITAALFKHDPVARELKIGSQKRKI